MAKTSEKTGRRQVMQRMTTAEATVDALLAHGIDTVYALPGVHNDHLFDALFKAQDRMRTVHTRHEQGAAYMALGAALATGKPQAYAVVPGPGLLNSAAALLTAYSMNAPVLALIGEIPDADIGRGISAICTRSATRPASSSGWSDYSALIRKPERGAAPGRRGVARRWRPAGPARRRSNARSTSGASPARSRRSAPLPVRQPPLDEDAIAQAAKLLGAAKTSDDRLRRRRAGRIRGGHRAVRHAAGAGARLSPRPRRARQPRSVQRDACRSAASCGARPTSCSASARAC